MHPMGKIPILRDGDLVVPDSPVICAYLDKKHPSPALDPSDPAGLAKARFLEEYADTQMAAALGAQLGNLTFSGVELDAARWPRTAAYYQALLARPSFETALAQ
jgi:glutathione S-transferase